MKQNCPHCGAPLPEAAAFCPHCARSVRERRELTAPKPILGKVLRVCVPLAVVCAVALSIFLYTRPRTYDSGDTAEVRYTDKDGTYQILLGWKYDRFNPVPQVPQVAELDGEYRFPVNLYINYAESGVNAKDVYLKKVDSVTAQFGPAANPDYPITYTDPAPHDYNPEAAMVSFVDFIGQENTVEGVWTIKMKNGDTILLRQNVDIQLIKTYNYYPEDRPMGTLAERQALVDEIAANESLAPKDVVNLHLPAVTYEGGLVIDGRIVNLYGSAEDGRRTTFTDTLQVISCDNQITYVEGIDFAGDGGGIGVSASARLLERVSTSKSISFDEACSPATIPTLTTAASSLWISPGPSSNECLGFGCHRGGA